MNLEMSTQRIFLKLLGILDDLRILFATQDFQDVQIWTNVICGDIFLLVKKNGR